MGDMKTESPVRRNTLTPVTLCSLQKKHTTQLGAPANLKTHFIAIMTKAKVKKSF